MSPHEELFHRLLAESSALLAAPESAGIAIPDDELHREIIVPLLPAMLADTAIRGHWSEQAATGFVARIGRHFENGEPAPRWLPGDFEIHVTASYSAGADARALADTLLSEDSLRDLTAALMNQLLDALWPSLAPAAPVPVIEIPAAEIPAPKIPAPTEDPAATEAPVAAKIPEPILSAETTPEPEPQPTPAPRQPVASGPEILPSAIPPSAIGPERPDEIPREEFHTAQQAPSRALIRTLCGKLATSAVQRGIAANSAQRGASAAIVARRILASAACPASRRRTICIRKARSS